MRVERCEGMFRVPGSELVWMSVVGDCSTFNVQRSTFKVDEGGALRGNVSGFELGRVQSLFWGT
jgi:hypothetical protein